MIRRLVQILFFAVAASLLPALPQGFAEEAAKPKKKNPNRVKKERAKGERADASAEEAVRTALPPELTAYFPIGSEFTGVSIPSYERDRLKSVLTSVSVIRVDDEYLDLHKLVIFVYNNAGEPETTISMEEAAYDLVNGVLTSKTPSKIEQPRFTMTGDKMTFQTDSQVARLTGNVRLVVPDANAIAPDLGFPGAAAKSAKPN